MAETDSTGAVENFLKEFDAFWNDPLHMKHPEADAYSALRRARDEVEHHLSRATRRESASSEPIPPHTFGPARHATDDEKAMVARASTGAVEALRECPHWSVSVEANGGTVLTIAHNHLAGADDIERHEATIRHAAHHLLTFIGDPHPEAGRASPPPAGDVERACEAAHLALAEINKRRGEPGQHETWAEVPGDVKADVREVIRAALSAMPPRGAEGWWLAPDEPTLEMEIAGRNAMQSISLASARRAFKAMKAAAPPPPAPAGEMAPVGWREALKDLEQWLRDIADQLDGRKYRRSNELPSSELRRAATAVVALQCAPASPSSPAEEER